MIALVPVRNSIRNIMSEKKVEKNTANHWDEPRKLVEGDRMNGHI